MKKLKDFGFYRGINLGGWLSQCDYSRDRLDNFITEKDLDVIAGWGLDHIRIPMDYNVLENEDGTLKQDGFNRVARAVGWAKKRNLKVVLDLHKTAGFSFDKDENEGGFFDNDVYQGRFYALWEGLAKAFYDPEHIAFELLNEVTDKEFIGAWNRIAAECIRRIRKIAPDTLILLGSYWNNSPDAVKDLEAPADERVIYNMHCYDPLPFTHQGAHWVPQLDINARVSFEEAGITEKLFEDNFASAIATAEERGTALYCGEYGVIENATPEDTVKWFKTIHAVFERHEIARSVWSYREMNFGLSDARLDGVRDELIRYL
jgi:aryl-phospho-beta-D-glucosidase BglC (GH1 family)